MNNDNKYQIEKRNKVNIDCSILIMGVKQILKLCLGYVIFFLAYFDPIKVLKENEKQENEQDIEYIFIYISTHNDFCTIY